MADFLRPEVRALAWRYRDMLFGAVVLLLGVFWAQRSFGILQWIGFGMIALGAIWAIAGVQRARFRQEGDGPGVVQIRERRLAYFGPLDGGVIDVEDLTMLEIDPSSHPEPSWILTGIGGQRISIPINAAGAEDLFDVFAVLPGIKTNTDLDVLSRTPNARVTVWHKDKPLLH